MSDPAIGAITKQPQAGNVNPDKILIPQKYLPQRQWSNKLVGDCCVDKNLCCKTFWCPCFVIQKITRQVGETEHTCVFSFCVQGNVWPLRTKLRTMVNIEGSLCEDTVAAWCCSYCAVCQMSRECDALEELGILDFN